MYWEDLDKICKACNEEWLSRLFRFAFFTGLRRMEIARLRWKDIDEERDLILIRKSKARKPQTAVLTSPAKKALPERRGNADYVWYATKPDRSSKRFADHLTRRFSHYREEAKIDRPITFHSLRHGFCTMLAEKGKSAHLIKAAARHADIQTSTTYVNLSAMHVKSTLREALG